jgi:metal-responsive CopG/Arc/MetJ family transcriptional regulator
MKNKEARIATRIDAQLAAKFEKIVEEQDLTKSQVLRRCIKEYVKKHEQEVKRDEE